MGQSIKQPIVRTNYASFTSPTNLPNRATLNFKTDSAALASSQNCKQQRPRAEANCKPYLPGAHVTLDKRDRPAIARARLNRQRAPPRHARGKARRGPRRLETSTQD